MKVIFDTNVVLDVLFRRKPFELEAAQLMTLAETDAMTGMLCATTITTVYHVVAREHDKAQALAGIQKLLKIFDIAPVPYTALDSAVAINFADFEDGVLHEAARFAGADAIVTRNGKDFKKATLAIYSPHELLTILTHDSSNS